MFITITIFIFTLLVLVVVHELGHFLMAKKFGIKVLEFGFGIPPRAWGKKFGETLISINWLPFGGFVHLLGEDEVDKKLLENHRSFAAQNVWKRIVVVVAGAVMNLFLAWIIFYVVIAAQGFRVIYPTIEPVVTVVALEDNFPAKEAGIKSGERLVSINGEKIDSIENAKSLIQDKAGKELSLTVSDIAGKNEREVKVVPKEMESGEGRIGVVFSPIPFKQYVSIPEKVFSGITYSWDLTRLTFAGLGKLGSDLSRADLGKASESVTSPIGLAVISGNILSAGWEAIIPYLWFVGVISLTLCIMNLLPIPALDGGRFFFLLIEAIIGKRLKPELERQIHAAGFAVLLTLMILIAVSDIQKFNLLEPLKNLF